MAKLTIAQMSSETLDRSDAVLAELHDMCCEPNRSPRMEALQATLSDVRKRIKHLSGDASEEREIVDLLAGAGAEIGRLQIECCAPARMPLYAELLAGLSRTQRMVSSPNAEMEH